MSKSRFGIDFLEDESSSSSSSSPTMPATKSTLVHLRQSFDPNDLHTCLEALSDRSVSIVERVAGLSTTVNSHGNIGDKTTKTVTMLQQDHRHVQNELYRVSEELKALHRDQIKRGHFEQFVESTKTSLSGLSVRTSTLEKDVHPSKLSETIEEILRMQVMPLLEKQAKEIRTEQSEARTALELRVQQLESQVASLTKTQDEHGPQIEDAHGKITSLEKRSELARVDLRRDMHDEDTKLRKKFETDIKGARDELDAVMKQRLKAVDLQVLDLSDKLREEKEESSKVARRLKQLVGRIEDVETSSSSSSSAGFGSTSAGSLFSNPIATRPAAAGSGGGGGTVASPPSFGGAGATNKHKRKEAAEKLRTAIIEETVDAVIDALISDPNLAIAIVQSALNNNEQQQSDGSKQKQNHESSSSDRRRSTASGTIFASSVEPVWFENKNSSNNGNSDGNENNKSPPGPAAGFPVARDSKGFAPEKSNSGVKGPTTNTQHNDDDQTHQRNDNSPPPNLSASVGPAAAALEARFGKGAFSPSSTTRNYSSSCASSRLGVRGRRPMSADSASASPSSLADLLFRFNENRFFDVTHGSQSPERKDE